MPRILAHVNVNPSHNYFRVHVETGKACGHIFQQLLTSNTTMKPTLASVSHKSVIKIAEAADGNSFWLLIWVDSSSSEEIENYLKTLFNATKVTVEFCSKCS